MMVFVRFSQWFQRVEHSPFHNGQNSLLCDFFVCVYDLLGFFGIFVCAILFFFSLIHFQTQRNVFYCDFQNGYTEEKNGFNYVFVLVFFSFF